MAEKNKSLELFLTFLRIGAFTFGGGYAMIPLIQKETVENKKWITDEDILEVVAIAESTPGPIAVNSATFVGYRVGGVKGAACATLGVVLPSFVVISVISLILSEFEHFRAVRYAFFGIRAGVLALLVKALVQMIKNSEKKPVPMIISLAAFIFAGILGANVLLILAASAVAGLAYSILEAKKGGAK